MEKHNATILVVEDDPNDQILIEMAFRENGVTCPIILLDGGFQAIAYLMGEGEYSDRLRYPYPALILTDLNMPRGDGFEVLQHLKNNPCWAVISAVVLSASPDPDDIRTAYMLGASSYHIKPPTYEGLRAQLKILHDYWMSCQFFKVDLTGMQLLTESAGKLGRRFPQPRIDAQIRVPL